MMQFMSMLSACLNDDSSCDTKMTTKKLIIAIAMIVVVISMVHSCSASITFIETSEVTDILGSPTDELEDSPLTDTSTSSVRLTLIPQGILMFEGNSTLTLHSGKDYSEASDISSGATGDIYFQLTPLKNKPSSI